MKVNDEHVMRLGGGGGEQVLPCVTTIVKSIFVEENHDFRLEHPNLFINIRLQH